MGMKITFNPNISYISPKIEAKTHKCIEAKPNMTMPKSYPVAFYGLIPEQATFVDNEIALPEKNQFSDEDFERAKKNLEEKRKLWENPDWEKVNGIQKDIKVFEGLSMKEIAYIFSNLDEILTYRGCSNRCSHCYMDAVPHHIKENSDMIKQMSWEDFNSLMNGLETLQQRFQPEYKILTTPQPLSSFSDADCTELYMKDAEGNIYDFADINDVMYEKTKKQGLFDTSGWTPWDKKLQERAEKIVDYFSEFENIRKIRLINISINPCHGLNERAIQLKNQGKTEAAQRFRNYYTDRIANTIFTFTPVLDSPKTNLFIKSVPKYDLISDDYGEIETKKLVEEIQNKVIELYKQDFKGAQKFIKSKERLDDKIEELKNKLDKKYLEILGVGRAKNIMEPYIAYDGGLLDYKIEKEQLYKGIDANGRIYIANDAYSIPTELQLNFANKNKKTPPLGEVLDKIITKEMINKIMRRL